MISHTGRQTELTEVFRGKTTQAVFPSARSPKELCVLLGLLRQCLRARRRSVPLTDNHFTVPFSQHFEADFSPFAKLLDSSSLPFADNYFAIF